MRPNIKRSLKKSQDINLCLAKLLHDIKICIKNSNNNFFYKRAIELFEESDIIKLIATGHCWIDPLDRLKVHKKPKNISARLFKDWIDINNRSNSIPDKKCISDSCIYIDHTHEIDSSNSRKIGKSRRSKKTLSRKKRKILKMRKKNAIAASNSSKKQVLRLDCTKSLDLFEDIFKKKHIERRKALLRNQAILLGVKGKELHNINDSLDFKNRNIPPLDNKENADNFDRDFMRIQGLKVKKLQLEHKSMTKRMNKGNSSFNYNYIMRNISRLTDNIQIKKEIFKFCLEIGYWTVHICKKFIYQFLTFFKGYNITHEEFREEYNKYFRYC